MKLSTTYLVAVLALGGQLASALPAKDSVAKRLAAVTEEIKWTGPIFPGDSADAHKLYGSASEIYSQIIALNPTFNKANSENSATSNKTVERRNKSNIICNQYAGGDAYDLQGERDYLHHIGGRCAVGGGQGTCIRMACKNTSGIFLCNDNRYPINPDCGYLASYADDIATRCGPPGANFGRPYSGQEFDTDNYNVIVGYANCNHSPHENPY